MLTLKQATSCKDGKLHLWIFRFFRRDYNPPFFPISDFLFLPQKRIRVISRNNPILDFTKEVHPRLLYFDCWHYSLSTAIGHVVKKNMGLVSVSQLVMLIRNCFISTGLPCVNEKYQF